MRLSLAICFVLAVFVPKACSQGNEMQIMKTSTGVRFGVWGPKSKRPAATLFIFSGTIEDSLGDTQYRQLGTILAKQGYLCVSLDMPCHGMQQRKDEPAGLDGWRYRMEHNEDFISNFVGSLKEVLDELIAKGYTDPNKVAVCGTSRGGFIALHFVAKEPRIKCAAVFIPVVDLGKLSEFKGMEKSSLVAEAGLTKQAKKLAGRPVFIIIGDQDKRVDTDSVIKFAREVSKVSGKKTDIELHVMPEPGGHEIPKGSAEMAAVWVAEKMETSKACKH